MKLRRPFLVPTNLLDSLASAAFGLVTKPCDMIEMP